MNSDQRLVSGQPFNPTHYDDMPNWHRLPEKAAEQKYESLFELFRDSIKYLEQIDEVIKKAGLKKV